MHGNEYQKKAKETAHYSKKDGIYYITIGLMGEAGEVANKVKKIIRDDGGQLTDQRREILKKELGDVMWYIAMLCTELGLNLDDVMEANNEKLASRKKRSKIQGDGDDR